MKLLIGDGFGSKTCDLTKKERIECKLMRYNEILMFQGLMVPKLEEKAKF
jgi:hypothetical protein